MRILRRAFLVLVAVLAIAGAIAATFPADTAYRLVSDRMGAIRLAAVSGTIWQGHAGSLQAFGQELGAVDWTLRASPLLRGTVAGHVNLGGGAITASGDFERDADAAITARNASVSFPASLAAPALDIPALTLLGHIDGRIEQATLRGAWVNAATGTLRWNQAAVAGAAQAQLGDIEAAFGSAADGSIAGQVRDLGGPLQVAGRFRVTAGTFDADATLNARDGNPQVTDALRFIGEPQADGSSHLIIHGQLFQIF